MTKFGESSITLALGVGHHFQDKNSSIRLVFIAIVCLGGLRSLNKPVLRWLGCGCGKAGDEGATVAMPFIAKARNARDMAELGILPAKEYAP